MNLQLIRMFAAGVVITPDREALKFPPAPFMLRLVEAITVVPSHSLQLMFAVAVSVAVIVPLAYQVPLVPCATLGPSKYVPVLLRLTSAPSELMNDVRLTAQVPEVVNVPPLRPVPHVTLVTEPEPAADQEGTPLEFSVKVCVPELLPARVTHAEPFQ